MTRRTVDVPGSWVDGAAAPLLALTLVLTAANLRSAVSAVGPVLRAMQADLGMSDTVAGVLTTLPVVCFGVVGLLAPRLVRRVDTGTTLVAVVAMLGAGMLVRPFVPSAAAFLLLSLLALVGIAIGNVLVPVAVKSWFPHDVGRVTGWYSMALAGGTAIPAALTVPAASVLGGWRGGLAIWALPALLVLVPWAGVARQGRRHRAASAGGSAGGTGGGGSAASDGTGGPGSGAWAAAHLAPAGDAALSGVVGAPAVAPATSAQVMAAVRRHPKSWALLVYFGLQSLEAYAVVGWLPTIYQDAGVAPGRAGVLLALTMGIGAPVSLWLPRVAARSTDQRPWVVVLSLASVGAYAGLLLAPGAAPLLWSVLLGFGLCAFPLALVLLGLRARTAAGTAALSSLTQGGGYLLAAIGPVAVGALHDATGSWTPPLLLLAGLLVPKLVAGLLAASPGSVDDAVLAR